MDMLKQTVRHQVLVALGVADLVIGTPPAGTGDTSLNVDYDVAWLDKLVNQQWRQRVQCRSGEAARVGNADLAFDLGWPDVG
ncbi:hypothetical protein D3C86_1592250 [compost metagenome]